MCEVARRSGWLNVDFPERALLEHETTHLTPYHLSRYDRLGLAVANHPPGNLSAQAMVQSDPSESCRRGLVPTRCLDELASEYRVLAVERVCELERVANPKVADQDRSRDLATVDALLEAGFPLQKTHR